MVQVMRSGGENVTEKDIGIWYGVDKLSANPGHYKEGLQPHGVHTLMGGMARRLEWLAANSRARSIVIMEGDATVVKNFSVKMREIASQLHREKFVWLGYFTSDKPNRYEGNEAQRGNLGPLFFGNATRPETFPDYGCQMFLLNREWIPEMLKDMRESMYPHGFDRWIFSPNFCSNAECTFTSRSLAGQQYGQSDSWNKLNVSVGQVEDPPDDEILRIRNFGESEHLARTRSRLWQKHRGNDKTARQRGAHGTRQNLAQWADAPPTLPPTPPVRIRPAASAALAAATPKAVPRPSPTPSSSDEDVHVRIAAQALWSDTAPAASASRPSS